MSDRPSSDRPPPSSPADTVYDCPFGCGWRMIAAPPRMQMEEDRPWPAPPFEPKLGEPIGEMVLRIAQAEMGARSDWLDQMATAHLNADHPGWEEDFAARRAQRETLSQLYFTAAEVADLLAVWEEHGKGRGTPYFSMLTCLAEALTGVQRVGPTVSDLPALYAYLGEDELAPKGEGTIGLKQGLVPAGMIALVSIDRTKLEAHADQMQAQATLYDRTIRLVRYVPVEEVLTLEPARAEVVDVDG